MQLKVTFWKSEVSQQTATLSEGWREKNLFAVKSPLFPLAWQSNKDLAPNNNGHLTAQSYPTPKDAAMLKWLLLLPTLRVDCRGLLYIREYMFPYPGVNICRADGST